MRLKYSIIFGILTLIIVACLIIAHRSRKAIGAYVSLVLVSLIPPIFGNLVIMNSEEELLSTVGCYLYSIGMDLLLFSLFRFSYEYCDLDWKKSKWKILICVLLAADALQEAPRPPLPLSAVAVFLPARRRRHLRDGPLGLPRAKRRHAPQL
ncbi:MAG: hypothetical protein J6P37_02125, partial [Lachnospiraceae bacterium]|nr:hypothetical protein [Lachnospiraceae bacterium]